MALDLQQELKQAHALLDQLPPAKLGAVRALLEVMLDDDEPVSDEDRRRFHEGQAFFASGKGIPMDDVLAEFGMKPEDFPLSK
ncbi:MAG: hypothetical protein NTX13_07735 [Acidobacteria bacterium]|jgi:hypothetical protein|nr:hypothetical protein [Acidobacteriota bacterium]